MTGHLVFNKFLAGSFISHLVSKQNMGHQLLERKYKYRLIRCQCVTGLHFLEGRHACQSFSFSIVIEWLPVMQARPLLFISGGTLAILWGRDCFFNFDSHSRNFSGRKAANGTAVLLKLLSLYHMDGYIMWSYFQGNSSSSYFQVQFSSCASIDDDMRTRLKIKNSFLTIKYVESKTAEFFFKFEMISICHFR